jgi:hypothetical protein
MHEQSILKLTFILSEKLLDVWIISSTDQVVDVFTKPIVSAKVD